MNDEMNYPRYSWKSGDNNYKQGEFSYTYETKKDPAKELKTSIDKYVPTTNYQVSAPAPMPTGWLEELQTRLDEMRQEILDRLDVIEDRLDHD